jgi:apolipoprotein N-acyltransferase
MRAAESGRFLIRAANDGISGVIGPRGEVVARAPEFVPTVLQSAVVPRTGLPPYARVGNWPVISLAALVLFVCLGLRMRAAPIAAARSTRKPAVGRAAGGHGKC